MASAPAVSVVENGDPLEGMHPSAHTHTVFRLACCKEFVSLEVYYK